MKHRIYELEKEMQMLQVDKERELRHLEEDFIHKTNELRKEMDYKNNLLDDEEERQARAMIEREKIFIEETNGKKLYDLQVEKDDLQRAIDF